MTDLHDFPTDDETLDLLALHVAPGGPKLSGLLDLLSAPDPSVRHPLAEGVVRVADRHSRDDVIRALAAALRYERQVARRALAAGVTHPARLLALSSALGAAGGSVIGWWLAGRQG